MNKIMICSLLLVPLATSAQDFGSEIEARQAAFESIEDKSENLEDMLASRNLDWAAIETQSQQLDQHGKSLSQLFPNGSADGSKAKEKVWQDPAKFERLLAEMQQGFEELYTASQAQAQSVAQAGLEQAQATCKGCHRTYRSRW